jgi:hypothetical protein
VQIQVHSTMSWRIGRATSSAKRACPSGNLTRRQRVFGFAASLVALLAFVAVSFANPSQGQEKNDPPDKIPFLDLYYPILDVLFPMPTRSPSQYLLSLVLRFTPAGDPESQINIVQEADGEFTVVEYSLPPGSRNINWQLSDIYHGTKLDTHDPHELAKRFKVESRNVLISSNVLRALLNKLEGLHFPTIRRKLGTTLVGVYKYQFWYRTTDNEVYFTTDMPTLNHGRAIDLANWMDRVKQAVDSAPTSSPPPVFPSPHPAGLQTGGVSGQVVDAWGKVIPGVAVVISDEINGAVWRPVHTDNAGIFSVADLPPGTYCVTIKSEIFLMSITCDVSVVGGKTRELTLTMNVKSLP